MNKEIFDSVASEAFDDEMKKIAINMAGVKKGAEKVIGSVKDAGKKVGSFYSGALKDAKTLPESIKEIATRKYGVGSKLQAAVKSQDIRKGLKGAGIIGGTAALSGMGLYKALKKD